MTNVPIAPQATLEPQEPPQAAAQIVNVSSTLSQLNDADQIKKLIELQKKKP